MVVAGKPLYGAGSGETGAGWDVQHATVCVVGLGYVGLPLAKAFSSKLHVIGFDVDIRKVNRLKRRDGKSGEEPPRGKPVAGGRTVPAGLTFTSDPRQIAAADFIIVCVPTPVTESKEPDLSLVKSAALTVSQNMRKGSTVILESTVYPGATEELVKPILEQSGLTCGRDFSLAYSSERINPADDEHAIHRVTKVVGGMDEETTDLVARLYGVAAPSVFKAKNIRTAEASKLVENIQRDANIALVNELSLIFQKLGLSTRDVLDAAETKWNFHRYTPGMVGGHCIAVDPYYLVHKAKEVGHHSGLILAGRATNDHMPTHIAGLALDALEGVGKPAAASRVLVVGMTYKENVPDTREAPVKKLVTELMQRGVEVYGYDPLVEGMADQFHVNPVSSLRDMPRVDGVVVALVHDCLKELTLDAIKGCCNADPVLVDVRGFFDRDEARRKGFEYRTL